MNKNTSNIHLEVLDKERQELLEKLAQFLKGFNSGKVQFILGGGTALTLQITHRKSFDFDFFCQVEIPKSLIEKLSRKISIANISIDSYDELTFFTKSEIKITFLNYHFPHAFPLLTLENGLQLFSVKDIAIKKAYTVGRRGEYRDYFDLYTILKNNHINLAELISETKKIYGSVFEEKIFLEQLVYFGDLLNFDIVPVSSKPVPEPEEIKRFLAELVNNYLKS